MNENYWDQFAGAPAVDCVKLKHELQLQVYESIKGMSPKDVLAYFEQRAPDASKHPDPEEQDLLLVREERKSYPCP